MDGVKISEIEGVLKDTITCHLDPIYFEEEQKYLKTDRDQRLFGEGYNKCILHTGQVRLTLSSNKIDQIFSKLPNYDDTQIFEESIWPMFREAIKNNDKDMIIQSFKFAVEKTQKECRDAIIANLPTLIEVVKEE